MIFCPNTCLAISKMNQKYSIKNKNKQFHVVNCVGEVFLNMEYLLFANAIFFCQLHGLEVYAGQSSQCSQPCDAYQHCYGLSSHLYQ